ncbi:ash family protein [Salmonella enterica]|nr:ash family protein [Salmonella enterica]
MWIKGDFHVFIVATKNIFANCLHWLAVMSYAYPAPYKTGAGICSPKLSKATPDAESVFFVVRYMRHSMAWCVIRQRSYNRRSVALLAYHAAHNGAVCGCCVRLKPVIDAQNRTPRRQRMVTLTGQPQGWPVPFDAGTANPVNVTAPIKICSLSGDSLIKSKEAVYHG